MPQEIYNEGRVVGLSAWEIFKREAEESGVDPAVIPNEREWLASMIGSGASMVLRIKSGKSGRQDFPLPSSSSLTAAGVIIASPFIGECELDGTGDTAWAKRVTSYNQALIGNSDSYPPTANNVPVDSSASPTKYADSVAEFTKITDGIVYLKKANWIDAGHTPPELPAKDIDPNLGKSTAVVRLYISSPLTTDVYVLFTGFHNKAIIQSLSGWAREEGGVAVGGSDDAEDNHNNWTNGGMLGPEIFPWASKIIFSVPNAASADSITVNRTLPRNATTDAAIQSGYTFENMQKHTVKSALVADFDSIHLNDYFRENNLNSYAVSEDLFNVSKGSASSAYNLVAWYPGIAASDIAGATGDDFFPPALYAANISSVNPTPPPLNFTTTAPSGLLVHSEPNTTSATTGSLAIFTTFSSDTVVIGEDVSGVNTWVYYDHDGITGYASGKYISPTPQPTQITQELYPIDVAAPGTVKYFTNQTKASNYVTKLPASCAIYHNTTANTLSFAYYDSSTSTVNWASPVSMSYHPTSPQLNISSGEVTASVLALTDSSGNAYPMTGYNGSIPIGPLGKMTWSDLLKALKNNRSLDILGARLRSAGDELEELSHSTFGMSTANRIDYIGSRWLMLNPGDPDEGWADSVDPNTNRPNSVWVGVKTYANDPANVRYLALDAGQTPNTSIVLGTEFMRFGNGLKFFISNTAPSTEGVPVGSIGIGW